MKENTITIIGVIPVSFLILMGIVFIITDGAFARELGPAPILIFALFTAIWVAYWWGYQERRAE